MALHLIMAVVRNDISEEEAVAEQARSDRIRAVEAMPDAAWPQLTISWDLNPEHFYYALDGSILADFARDYPNITVIGVGIEDWHAHLLPMAQRVKGPLSKSYRFKSAALITHLESGGSVTPPLVRHSAQGLYFDGGNHRFGWARHLAQGEIPILVVTTEKPAIEAVLTTAFSWPPSKTDI